MSCSRPAVWASSCSSSERPGRRRDLARVAGDRGAVARGHPVAEVERAQQGAQQGDLEAGELLGPQLELVGALLGDQQGADQVLEDDHDDGEQGDGRKAELDVEVGDADGQQGGGELGGEQGGKRAARLGPKRGPLHVAEVARDQGEVDRQGDDEEAEHEQVEERVRLADPGPLEGRREGEPGEQREPGVGDQVDQQGRRRVAEPQPPGGDGGDPDHGRRRLAQEDRGGDDGQEARRDRPSGWPGCPPPSGRRRRRWPAGWRTAPGPSSSRRCARRQPRAPRPARPARG